MTARAGKGFLDMLTLDTAFPRIPGPVVGPMERAPTPALLHACGLDQRDERIAGLEGEGVWRRSVPAPKAAQAREPDAREIGGTVEAAARALVDRASGTGAIVFECTSLPPYEAGIRAATGRPVFHILHAAAMLRPHAFATVGVEG